MHICKAYLYIHEAFKEQIHSILIFSRLHIIKWNLILYRYIDEHLLLIFNFYFSYKVHKHNILRKTSVWSLKQLSQQQQGA